MLQVARKLVPFLQAIQQHLPGQSGVGHWVVQVVVYQAVILDQPVIGFIGKEERGKQQGIDKILLQKNLRHARLLEKGKVVRKNIMPAQISSGLGEALKIADSGTMPGLFLVNSAYAADPCLGLSYFQVEKNDVC
jgi:hypothetical protein